MLSLLLLLLRRRNAFAIVFGCVVVTDSNTPLCIFSLTITLLPFLLLATRTLRPLGMQLPYSLLSIPYIPPRVHSFRHHDGDLKDFSLEGLFSPNPADGWIEICDGFAQGMGNGEPTTIAENHCVPIEIMEGTPNTFHIRAISCTCSEVQQFQVPSNCTCGSYNSKYGNMTHSYAQYSGLPCSAGTNFPTTSGPTYSAPTASPSRPSRSLKLTCLRLVNAQDVSA